MKDGMVKRLQRMRSELDEIITELAGDESDKVPVVPVPGEVSKGTLAAKKAWETMRAREANMTPAQLKSLHAKRSNASKKAWVTMRKAA
jgi:hypothetical protein